MNWSVCRYLQSTIAAASLTLTPVDVGDIEGVLCASRGPQGPVYGLERQWEGPHASIMKYNLNQVNQGAHLEELCHRYNIVALTSLYLYHYTVQVYFRRGLGGHLPPQPS